MSLSTMFLLGAGASQKAGINGIESMTDSFLDDLSLLVQFYAWNVQEKTGSPALESMASDYYAPRAHRG